ncbi:hypothetical protein [Solibaculum mannosilyticum]|uniref:hypothetical protein n=1 Tax=Solibaculum mannosilyticum TaxID=2780922 RepID=UPI0007A8465D|nr:hypothetical protein BN3661_00605 [Eubacteriaceae bacterium CHKCI005]
MNRRILLLAVALAICLTASGCRMQKEDASSSAQAVVSQQAVSQPSQPPESEPEPESVGSSSLPESSSTQYADVYPHDGRWAEELAELRHGLSLTNPESPVYGRMNNGFVGIQTEVYEEGNVRMKYPVLSDNRYIPDKPPSAKADPDYFGYYPILRELLKSRPMIFLQQYDLQSEGTSLDMTYEVIRFTPSGLTVHYFGTYTSEERERIPVHFIVGYDCDSGMSDSTDKYSYVSNLAYIPEYMVGGYPYTVVSEDPSKQQAAEAYIKSMDVWELTDLLGPIHNPEGWNTLCDIDKGEFPDGYYYRQDDKLITLLQVPEEYGYWITITIAIDDMANSDLPFGIERNPNWRGNLSSSSN